MAKINIELEPWVVPNFVRQKTKPSMRQEGYKEGLSISIKDLDEDVLSDLCDEFRQGIFKKAGKVDSKLTIL